MIHLIIFRWRYGVIVWMVWAASIHVGGAGCCRLSTIRNFGGSGSRMATKMKGDFDSD